LLVHAPGRIGDAHDADSSASFVVEPWSKQPGRMLISGLQNRPQVLIDDVETSVSAPHQYVQDKGWLIFQLSGRHKITVR
jgi:hypothetical protein